MTNSSFSVLIATYAGEQPDRLKAALESMVEQTLSPSEIVLVVDGPVPAPQEDVIARFADSEPPLTVVRRERCDGLARALNDGLARCSGEFVVRMDSDDISHPQRLALQSQLLRADPRLDVVSSWHAEFVDGQVGHGYLKKTPATHAEIVRSLRRRNPISHPTVVIRRSLLEKVGGYRNVPLLEDYDLYLRLARAGARFAALQQPLVHVRVSEQRSRRGGVRYLATNWRLRYRYLRRGYLGPLDFLLGAIGSALFALSPIRVREALYRLVRARAGSTDRYTSRNRPSSSSQR